jgi:hypothetical protein
MGVAPRTGAGVPTLAEMPTAACWQHLAAAYTVTLCFAHDGDLHAMPMNASVVAGEVWVRASGKVARSAAEQGVRMAVTVGEHDLTEHTGWSVTARGPAAVAPGPPSEGAPPLRPWRPEARDRGTWVRISVDTITGRRLGAVGPQTGGRS